MNPAVVLVYFAMGLGVVAWASFSARAYLDRQVTRFAFQNGWSRNEVITAYVIAGLLFAATWPLAVLWCVRVKR